MTLKYNVTGSERKKLVNAIAEILECKARYLGMPSMNYEVDYFTIGKDGSVTFDDRADSEEIENLIEQLYERGYTAESCELDKSILTISVPRDMFTDRNLCNLENLIKAKGSIIKKALGVNDLTILKGESEVSFPWFSSDCDSDEIKAYSNFITALCKMATTQKRINASEKAVDNEKYAFRCFILRLGFIGKKYAAERKILLSRLSGNSAFKNKNNEEAEI